MHRVGILAIAALLVAGGANAQDNYPSQTVKIVIPSAPGSTTDILARLTADQLGRKWGKPTVVENIAGGTMNIGAAAVARAAPDGYTLFVAPPAPIALAHLLSKNLSYNPLDWVPITHAGENRQRAVGPNEPAGKHAPGADRLRQGQSRQAHLRDAGPDLDRASFGGAARSAGRIKMLAVAYRGAQPALTDVIAGNVDMFFDTLATSVPLHRAGKLKILAVADLQRAKTAPDLPTFTEAGMPGFRSITWFGLVAPPGTPAALAQRINRDAVEMLRARRWRHGCRASRSRSARRPLPKPRRSSPAKPRSGARSSRKPASPRSRRYFTTSKLCAKSSGGFGPHM